ncbi:NADH:flavin oxidoreductase/NADH oxidase [Komagataeibacter sp. FNDCR2]|uniref:NADH:flavin oxidoreductase/NADH oxidase n=1 Tax=Komagataeibacter sp. FNDCR2 TaxID=2878682 RepID=UPI001E5525C3|nr:NADH:flavin oxidoreductase/NADH oxidase [Komagataeibacter sp. FNDCR2]MCE2575973.1 NADH:flavin oxidoreductase/NADH oxidase [Komagataeibacter sp. FNDCR2]
MTDLFTPYTLKGETLRNRIAVSPMCQYMAVDGVVNDWHNVHYPTLARGGAGLVVVEATAVSPEGRITPGCLGLWNDAQAEAFRPLVRAIRDAGAVPGIQIAHAGRKASANRPWEGDDHIAADDPRGWETIAPSALAYGDGLPKVPRAMTVADITRVRQDFVASARRARDAGFGWLMLHFAHGYLAQSFLSTHSNQRDDGYGGSLENRARFLVETLQEVRAVWPEDRPLSARLGMIEFDGQDEQTLRDAITVARIFRDSGLDFLDVSIGFSTPGAKIPWGPSFMAPIAQRVRHESGLPVATSWYLGNAGAIDGLIRTGQIDLAMIGRPFLENPHWPYAAARALGREDAPWVLPAPYAHWLSRYRSL